METQRHSDTVGYVLTICDTSPDTQQSLMALRISFSYRPYYGIHACVMVYRSVRGVGRSEASGGEEFYTK